jgi:hypothetical protein
MQVAKVIGAAFGKGNDVVDVESRLLIGFTAALTLGAIAFQNIFPNFWRN